MKRNIAIIAGGDSSEHEVSLRSAAGLYSFMDKERYDISVVVLKGKEWKAIANDELSRTQGVLNEELMRHACPIDKNDFSFTRGGVKHSFDFAYITIHGTPGENGLLQGYLEMMGIPYSCCNVLAAALTFNKYTCNHYLAPFGFPIAQSILLRKNNLTPSCSTDGHRQSDRAELFTRSREGEELAKRIENELGLPCFITSNVGGSSFGCTKVKTEAEVIPAIERAFQEGDEVICEAYMKGTEVTCGVYKTKEKAVAFPITEVVTKNEFFDYDAKYKGQVSEITPARIPDAIRDKIQAETLRIYDIIGASGIIRVDWIITGMRNTEDYVDPVEDMSRIQINLLEVNTTPGMTATSFIPQQVRAAGLDIKDVLTDIIENKFN
jgi:D-alanine-D-alanine ligase